MSTAAYRYAQAMAVTERARGRAEEERAWLDLLALLDAPAPAPSVVPESAVTLRAVIDEALADALGNTFSPSVMDDLTQRVHANVAAALPLLTAAPSATREEVTRAIRSVTDRWDEPLDEVHDVPPIADAILARFTITSKEDR